MCTIDWLVFLMILVLTVFVTYINFKKQRNILQNLVADKAITTSQKSKYNVLEYWMAGRKMTLPFFVASLVTSWYGGIFGVGQTSFLHGIYNFFSQGLVWYFGYIIFAFYITKNLKNLHALTLSELAKQIYGEKSGKLIAILMLFKTLPITYAIALGSFLAIVFDITTTEAIIYGTGFVTFYCCFGGLRSLMARDMIQFVSMYIVVISIVYFSYLEFGGISYLQQKLEPHYFAIQGKHQFDMILLWLLAALMTTFTSPLFYQRCMAAESPKTARNGILISVVFWCICDFATTIGGMYARAYNPNYDSLLAYMLYGMEILPIGFKGLMLSGILAIILSTLDAFLFISSSILAYDLMKKNLRNSTFIRLSALCTCSIITSFIAINFNGTIEEIWIYSKSYFGAPLVVQIIMAYLLPKKKLITDIQCFNIILLTISSVIITQWIGFRLQQAFYNGIIINSICFIACFLYNKKTAHTFAKNDHK